MTQYIGMSVTGIARIGKLEYLVTSLNNKVFYLKLSILGRSFRVQEKQIVDNTSTSELHTYINGAYGIAASKNSALIFIAMYPQTVSFEILLSNRFL